MGQADAVTCLHAADEITFTSISWDDPITGTRPEDGEAFIHCTPDLGGFHPSDACNRSPAIVDPSSLHVVMAIPSIEGFRSSLRLTWESPDTPGELILSYWSNASATSSFCDTEETLHISRRRDGSFQLQIANLVHTGTLEELEEILYGWALDEGWLLGSYLA